MDYFYLTACRLSTITVQAETRLLVEIISCGIFQYHKMHTTRNHLNTMNLKTKNNDFDGVVTINCDVDNDVSYCVRAVKLMSRKFCKVIYWHP